MMHVWLNVVEAVLITFLATPESAVTHGLGPCAAHSCPRSVSIHKWLSLSAVIALMWVCRLSQPEKWATKFYEKIFEADVRRADTPPECNLAFLKKKNKLWCEVVCIDFEQFQLAALI